MTAFSIAVPDAVLDDLRGRLRATRWPDAVVEDWSQGMAPAALREFIDYWAERFDWRATERRLNAVEQQLVDGIHVLRAGTPGATPLLLIHGWPDSILRFERALPLLADRFDIVVPSIPGYGFSARPTGPSGPDLVADRFAGVMTTLGFDRFGVHGADIGAHIADQLAVRHGDRLIGVHFGNIVMSRLATIAPEDRTDDDRAWAAAAAAWDAPEGGYMHLQRTKPQTLAVSLSDSPAGLAAWFLEKFASWTQDPLPDEDLAANLTIYWATETAGSSARYYYDAVRADLRLDPVTVPTGVTQFPHELIRAPRSSAERFYPIVHWTDAPLGGHFGPWEQPEFWARDLTAFFDAL